MGLRLTAMQELRLKVILKLSTISGKVQNTGTLYPFSVFPLFRRSAFYNITKCHPQFIIAGSIEIHVRDSLGLGLEIGVVYIFKISTVF